MQFVSYHAICVLQNHKVTCQRCWDTHIRRSLQDASGDTALFTIVTLKPAQRGLRSTELLALLHASSGIISLIQPVAMHHQSKYYSVG